MPSLGNKAWMTKHRLSPEYLDGLVYFIKFTKENGGGFKHFPCPCVKCQNGKGMIALDLIHEHLLINGIDKSYIRWSFHGESLATTNENPSTSPCKAKLRTKYLDPHTTHDERLNSCSSRVRPEDWEAFIEHNSENAEVKKNMDIYHMSGRHGHMRLEEKIKRQKKENDHPPTRAEVWNQAHTKDVFVLNSASSHMESVKELLFSQDEVNSHDILNDPLTQVFDVNTRRRVQGSGKVLRTQSVVSSSTLKEVTIEERRVTEQSTPIKDLKSQVDYLRKELEDIKQLIKRMPSGSLVGTLVPPKMLESVAASNTIGNDQPSMRLRSCKLLSWRQEVVAHGRAYIGNEPQQIHCKSFPKNAYMVLISVIDKGDVELPYPYDNHSTLGEVGNGSFVAWPMASTTFTD